MVIGAHHLHAQKKSMVMYLDNNELMYWLNVTEMFNAGLLQPNIKQAIKSTEMLVVLAEIYLSRHRAGHCALIALF